MEKKSTVVFGIVVIIMACSLALDVWGSKKSLPYGCEGDEETFVGLPVKMAAARSANPGWFGHPGSTIMYPLAAIFRIRYGDSAQTTFAKSPGQFYYTGRMLVIAYAVFSIPFIYLVGREVFGPLMGLMGAWLFALCPLAVTYSQVTRTDTAAVFFGMLSLWRILKTYKAPTARNHVWAGLAIGLSIATRYFMVALIPVLLAVDCALFFKAGEMRKKIIAASCAGFICVGAAFALSTPYFFLDFKAARLSLHEETEATHLDSKAFSPKGNLQWYVRDAIPGSMTSPAAFLAFLGGLLIVFRRRFVQCLIPGYAVAFLLTLSALSRHWERWIIPVLPVLTLMAVFFLDAVTRWIFGFWKKGTALQYTSLALCLAAMCVLPGYETVLHDIRESHTSTRIEAREWILNNVPAGSHIALDGHTAPLVGTSFAVKEAVSLAERNSVGGYFSQGYRYIVVRRDVENRYLSKPAQFRKEVEFYHTLSRTDRLLATFGPSDKRGGPVISIYQLASEKKRG